MAEQRIQTYQHGCCKRCGVCGPDFSSATTLIAHIYQNTCDVHRYVPLIWVPGDAEWQSGNVELDCDSLEVDNGGQVWNIKVRCYEDPITCEQSVEWNITNDCGLAAETVDTGTGTSNDGWTPAGDSGLDENGVNRCHPITINWTASGCDCCTDGPQTVKLEVYRPSDIAFARDCCECLCSQVYLTARIPDGLGTGSDWFGSGGLSFSDCSARLYEGQIVFTNGVTTYTITVSGRVRRVNGQCVLCIIAHCGTLGGGPYLDLDSDNSGACIGTIDEFGWPDEEVCCLAVVPLEDDELTWTATIADVDFNSCVTVLVGTGIGEITLGCNCRGCVGMPDVFHATITVLFNIIPSIDGQEFDLTYHYEPCDPGAFGEHRWTGTIDFAETPGLGCGKWEVTLATGGCSNGFAWLFSWLKDDGTENADCDITDGPFDPIYECDPPFFYFSYTKLASDTGECACGQEEGTYETAQFDITLVPA